MRLDFAYGDDIMEEREFLIFNVFPFRIKSTLQKQTPVSFPKIASRGKRGDR